MKRAPARLLETASLSPLERRILAAGRAARVDFDVVASAERLRHAIHASDAALPAGAEETPKLVNLEFSLEGKSATTVPGVGSESACDPMRGGWYYDNPATPKRLITCPATCQAFDDAAEVNVVLGCPTIGPE